ncbi:hypothetical protein ACQ27_gp482 [Klebsiella phage K64-1]|uniref:hypothetical protein n=1 Tax=Klebsiella phage K64-1 TaxID=1439894 RepID=UPI00248ABE52|nr:hypothetical protein ACQ27_gp482 [Klebsiella phage K64-1]
MKIFTEDERILLEALIYSTLKKQYVAKDLMFGFLGTNYQEIYVLNYIDALKRKLKIQVQSNT